MRVGCTAPPIEQQGEISIQREGERERWRLGDSRDINVTSAGAEYHGSSQCSSERSYHKHRPDLEQQRLISTRFTLLFLLTSGLAVSDFMKLIPSLFLLRALGEVKVQRSRDRTMETRGVTCA